MQEITDVFEARDFVLAEYGGEILDGYIDQVNDNYRGNVVGYIFKIDDCYFFMRFRRSMMKNFSQEYPQVEGAGWGFCFNRSEIEAQINGLHARDRNLKNVWCMVVRPNGTVYVVHPIEVKEFIRKFNTTKSLFNKEGVPQENEELWNVPFSMMINMDKWLEGKRVSDYDWRNIGRMNRNDYVARKPLTDFIGKN